MLLVQWLNFSRSCSHCLPEGAGKLLNDSFYLSLRRHVAVGDPPALMVGFALKCSLVMYVPAGVSSTLRGDPDVVMQSVRAFGMCSAAGSEVLCRRVACVMYS